MADIYDHLAALIMGYKPAVSRVLDLGAGKGTLGLYLYEYGYEGVYRGVDKDPACLEAMRDHGLHVERADIKWLAYPKFTWEIVTMQDVIEHLEEISVLTDIIGVARRYFILTTEIPIVDAITPVPLNTRYFHIDDLISMARVCNFALGDYQRVGNHSVLVFNRRRGKH